MASAHDSDPAVFTIARFQTCTADLRQTVAHLRDLAQEMSEVAGQMRAEGQPRHRLMVAEAIISEVQTALWELDGSAYPSPHRFPLERQAIAQ